MTQKLEPKLDRLFAGEEDAVAEPPSDLNYPLNANCYFSFAFLRSFMKLSYFKFIFYSYLFRYKFFYALLVAILFSKFVISVFCFPLRVFREVSILFFLFESQV